MTEQEKADIRRFAQGDKGLRDKALAAYRRYLPVEHAKERETDEWMFMSEIDNVVPDLALRATLRGRILGHCHQ